MNIHTGPTRKDRAGDRWARFERRCRSGGVSLTVQRRAVFEALAAREDHPTAEELWGQVHPRVPGLSRTTVYRILETFERLGVARAVCHPGSSTRYDANMEPHHHLVCIRCGKVRDTYEPRLDRLPLPARRLGFRVLDASVYLRGVCPDCSSEKRGRAGKEGAR